MERRRNHHPPTCKDEGVKTYTCTVCGETKTEAIAKTADHVWDDGVVTLEPTYNNPGEKNLHLYGMR